MRLNQLINSEEFKDANRKIGKWKESLEDADRRTIMRIRDEKAIFFSNMRKSRPDLYMAFQMDDKVLSEAILKKLTGEDVIID